MNFNISELVYCAIVRLCKANRAQLNFILRRAARNSAFGKKKKKKLSSYQLDMFLCFITCCRRSVQSSVKSGGEKRKRALAPVFPRFSLGLIFVRGPLHKRLEQDTRFTALLVKIILVYKHI